MNVLTEWKDKDWDKFTKWLKSMLTMSDVTVTFTKTDGTERIMKCTLNPEMLPKVEPKTITEDAKPRKENTSAMRVFDLEKNEWRSFTIKNVTRVELTV